MRLSTFQVRVVHPDATDPLSIVNAAINYVSLESRDQWTKDDTAWAVFDGDEHRDSNPHNWNDAVQRAKSHGINLAISNPCFELWYLLYYQDQFAKLSAMRHHGISVGTCPNMTKPRSTGVIRLSRWPTWRSIEQNGSPFA